MCLGAKGHSFHASCLKDFWTTFPLLSVKQFVHECGCEKFFETILIDDDIIGNTWHAFCNMLTVLVVVYTKHAWHGRNLAVDRARKQSAKRQSTQGIRVKTGVPRILPFKGSMTVMCALKLTQ